MFLLVDNFRDMFFFPPFIIIFFHIFFLSQESFPTETGKYSLTSFDWDSTL